MPAKTPDTVTARELRLKWTRITRLVRNGKTILVTKDGEPLMQLAPPPRVEPVPAQWPDFLNRALAISHGKISDRNILLEERASHKW